MSDKKLYDKIKAEQDFLSLINATVSHELRNPLASLIGQIYVLNDLLGTIAYLIAFYNSKT